MWLYLHVISERCLPFQQHIQKHLPGLELLAPAPAFRLSWVTWCHHSEPESWHSSCLMDIKNSQRVNRKTKKLKSNLHKTIASSVTHVRTLHQAHNQHNIINLNGVHRDFVAITGYLCVHILSTQWYIWYWTVLL